MVVHSDGREAEKWREKIRRQTDIEQFGSRRAGGQMDGKQTDTRAAAEAEGTRTNGRADMLCSAASLRFSI